VSSRKEKTVAAILTAETGQLRRKMTEAGGYVGNFSKKVEGASVRMRSAMRNVGFGNVTSRLKGMVGSIAGFAGIYGIGKVIQDVRDFEDSLADLAIMGNKNLKEMDVWRKQITTISSATGRSREEIASFAAKFTELTGDVDFAMGRLEQMTKVSVATNASMVDLATVLEQLSGGFRLAGKDAYAAFNILAFQAQKGMMSFKSMASLLPEISGAAGAFGPSAQGIQGIGDVGALMQLAIRKAGSPREAGTAVKRFLEQVQAKRAKLEQLTGAQFMQMGPGGKMQWKSLQFIGKSIGKALVEADPDKRAKIKGLLDIRGGKLGEALAEAYGVGWTKKVGKREAAATLFGAGKRDVIGEMYAKRMDTPGQQMRKTMTELYNQIQAKALPAFKALAKHMPTIAKGIGWAVENLESLIRVWMAWKASRFFAGLAQVPQRAAGAQAARMAMGGYGPGGQVQRMYGPQAGRPGVQPVIAPTPGPGTLQTGANLWMLTELMDLGVKGFFGPEEGHRKQKKKGFLAKAGSIFRGVGFGEDFKSMSKEMFSGPMAEIFERMSTIGKPGWQSAAINQTQLLQNISNLAQKMGGTQEDLRGLTDAIKDLKSGIPVKGGKGSATPEDNLNARINTGKAT
jgi:TP901 family phage tail tape measure protein